MNTMIDSFTVRSCPSRGNRARIRLPFALTAFVILLTLSGCAALTNPVGDGVPVRQVSPEMLGRPREEEKTIPLKSLRQKPPDVYRLDAGDVLGVWIETVLGERNQPPPVHVAEQGNLPPALGYPIPVGEDGTIALPLIDPLPVKRLTIVETREAIRKAYTVTKKVLIPGQERILVTLQRPRHYHVLVIRQDSGGLTVGQTGAISSTKRGTGFELYLSAYKNDVLSALARTGGFPGLDAKNEIIIERGSDTMPPGEAGGLQECRTCPVDGRFPPSWGGGEFIRIPLRLRPEEGLPFKPEDIVLRNGDIVYIESRDTEVFYTGGLLGSGQFGLPRDYDLNVVDAICLARGPLVSGGINQNNLSGAILAGGIGFPSPSLVTILRRTPAGGQLAIKVDLNRALRDPRERILIQPKDVIILQQTVGEAIAQYFTTVFRLSFFGVPLRHRDATATTTVVLP